MESENRVSIRLEDFIDIRDKMKELEFLNNTIIDYILSQTGLEGEKLTIDYNIRYSNFLTEIVKKRYPEKYDKKLKELKEENRS